MYRMSVLTGDNHTRDEHRRTQRSHGRSAAGTLRDAMPLVIPTMKHLDNIKWIMVGDVTEPENSHWRNDYKVDIHERAVAIHKFSSELWSDEPLRAELRTLACVPLHVEPDVPRRCYRRGFRIFVLRLSTEMTLPQILLPKRHLGNSPRSEKSLKTLDGPLLTRPPLPPSPTSTSTRHPLKNSGW